MTSPVGFVAVLVHEQRGEMCVCCYGCSLSNVERHKKESVGLVWACERFHLYDVQFELATDDIPLEAFCTHLNSSLVPGK